MAASFPLWGVFLLSLFDQDQDYPLVYGGSLAAGFRWPSTDHAIHQGGEGSNCRWAQVFNQQPTRGGVTREDGRSVHRRSRVRLLSPLFFDFETAPKKIPEIMGAGSVDTRYLLHVTQFSAAPTHP